MRRRVCLGKSMLAGLLALGMSGLLAPSAQSAEQVWVGNTDANFATTSNWSSAFIDGDSMRFDIAGTSGASLNNDLAVGSTVAGIAFSSNAPTYTISGNAIKLGGNIALDTGATCDPTINLDMELTADRSITTRAGADITLGGNISGAYKLSKGAGGYLTLSGANTFSGGLQVSLGGVNINSSTALGTGTFTLSGATIIIDNTSAAAKTLTTNNDMVWGGNIRFIGTKSLNLGTGAVTMNAARTVTTDDNILTVGGVLSGNDGSKDLNVLDVTKAGANGILSFSNTGGITLRDGGQTNSVTAGTLTVAGTVSGYNGENVFDALTKTGAGTLNLTGTGAVLSSNQSVSVEGILQLGSVVSDLAGTTNNLTVAAGGLQLDGENTYGGTTYVNAGANLRISKGSGLGTTNNGTVVASGASLRMQESMTNAENIVLSGVGTNPLGANNNGALVLNKNTGTFQLDGKVTLDGGATIATYAAGLSQVTFSQGIDGTGDLKLQVGSANNGNAVFYMNGKSTYTGNTYLTFTNMNTKYAYVQLGTEDALPTTTILNMATEAEAGKTNLAKVVLNGFNQQLAGLNSTTFDGAIQSNMVVNGSATAATLTVNNTVDSTFDGYLGGAGTDENNFSLVKKGSGKLILTGTGTYTNGTTVNAGTLIVNGSLAGALIVDAGATLGGSGTIGGATTISGTHNPGNSPGLQTFATDLTYSDGSVVTWELMANALGVRGVDYDGIDVGGDLTVNAVSTVNLVFNGAGSAVDWSDTFWDSDHSWTFYDVAGSLTGAFTLGSISKDAFGQDATGTFSVGYSGNNVLVNYSSIPEPAVVGLMALACASMIVRRRMRLDVE